MEEKKLLRIFLTPEFFVGSFFFLSPCPSKFCEKSSIPVYRTGKNKHVERSDFCGICNCPGTPNQMRPKPPSLLKILFFSFKQSGTTLKLTEHLPGNDPERNYSSNRPFSGAKMFVSGRVYQILGKYSRSGCSNSRVVVVCVLNRNC